MLSGAEYNVDKSRRISIPSSSLVNKRRVLADDMLVEQVLLEATSLSKASLICAKDLSSSKPSSATFLLFLENFYILAESDVESNMISHSQHLR